MVARRKEREDVDVPKDAAAFPIEPGAQRFVGKIRVEDLCCAIVDVVVLVVIVGLGIPEGTMPPPVFVGEFIALGLFFVFWVLQTVQNWNSVDPRFAPTA